MSERDLSGIDPSEYKNIPGNQTANTPDVNEASSVADARTLARGGGS